MKAAVSFCPGFHFTCHHFQFVSVVAVSVVCELVHFAHLLFVSCISVSLARFLFYPLILWRLLCLPPSNCELVCVCVCWLSFQLDWKTWIYCFYSQTFKNLLLPFSMDWLQNVCALPSHTQRERSSWWAFTFATMCVFVVCNPKCVHLS